MAPIFSSAQQTSTSTMKLTALFANFDVNSLSYERDKLDELYTLFDLKNFIISETSIIKTQSVNFLCYYTNYYIIWYQI